MSLISNCDEKCQRGLQLFVDTCSATCVFEKKAGYGPAKLTHHFPEAGKWAGMMLTWRLRGQVTGMLGLAPDVTFARMSLTSMPPKGASRDNISHIVTPIAYTSAAKETVSPLSMHRVGDFGLRIQRHSC
jgi:hypothetical protein